MKKILFLIAIAASLTATAQSTWTPVPGKSRYNNGVAFGCKDSSAFTFGADTVFMYASCTDSGMYVKFKGYYRKLAYDVPGGGYVKVSDTLAMLAPYLRKVDTLMMLNPYLRKSDTATMLNTYARFLHVVKYYDTAAMLNPGYVRANRLNDTAAAIRASLGTSSPFQELTAGNITSVTSGANLSITGLFAGANAILSGDLDVGGDVGGLTATIGTINTDDVIVSNSVSIGGPLTVTGGIAGTLTTAAQPNITSVGTLSSLVVSGLITTGNLSAVSTVLANTISVPGTIWSIGAPGTNMLVGGTTVSGVLWTMDHEGNLTSSGTIKMGTMSTTGQGYVGGDLGIGETVPTGNLHVKKSAPVVTIQDQTSRTSGTHATIGFANSGNSDVAKIIVTAEGSNTATKMKLQTRGGGSLTDALILDEAQNTLITQNAIVTATVAAAAASISGDIVSVSSAPLLQLRQNATMVSGTRGSVIAETVGGSSAGGIRLRATGDLSSTAIDFLDRATGAAITTAATIENHNLSVVGSITGASIVKQGGTSSQFLMADGSTSTGPTGSVTIAATGFISGQTTDQTVCTYTTGAADSTFEVSSFLNNTAIAGAGADQMIVTWTDETNAAQTVALQGTTTSVFYFANPTRSFRVKASTTITVSVDVVVAGATYNAGCAIKRL